MDTPTFLLIITTVLGSGAVSALVSGIMANRKTKAEAKSIERTVEQKAIEVAETTYNNIIATLKLQVKSQADRISCLETETAEQKSQIDLLSEQVEQLREVNASLLEKNAELHEKNLELQNKVKQCEDCEELFGNRAT
jgi:predicted RNase H-like nuclease (RuvC/YqgF family)